MVEKPNGNGQEPPKDGQLPSSRVMRGGEILGSAIAESLAANPLRTALFTSLVQGELDSSLTMEGFKGELKGMIINDGILTDQGKIDFQKPLETISTIGDLSNVARAYYMTLFIPQDHQAYSEIQRRELSLSISYMHHLSEAEPIIGEEFTVSIAEESQYIRALTQLRWDRPIGIGRIESWNALMNAIKGKLDPKNFLVINTILSYIRENSVITQDDKQKITEMRETYKDNAEISALLALLPSKEELETIENNTPIWGEGYTISELFERTGILLEIAGISRESDAFRRIRQLVVIAEVAKRTHDPDAEAIANEIGTKLPFFFAAP